MTHDQSGFTLIELLVTLAIFSSIMTAASGIFIHAQRAQRRTENRQATQTDARFALEVMAREVRGGKIDYGAYGGTIGVSPQAILALIQPSGEKIQFRRAVVGSRGEAQVSQDGGVTWLGITPPELSVSALAFYISPSTDPFAALPQADQPPLVTIAMSTISLQAGGGETPTFLQTSVSSRQYLR